MIHSDTKQAKAAAIHQSLLAIADFYNVPAASVLSEGMDSKKPVRDARAALMHHLRQSGMSYDAVGRVVRRSSDTVRQNSRKAALLTGDERAMLDSLPAIPNTLVLATTKTS